MSSRRPLQATPRAVVLPCRIEVVGSGEGLSVHAAEPIGKGEVALRVVGLRARRPDRHSLQVGRRTHLVAPPDLGPQVAVAEYGWRFLNHACEPNTWLRGMELVAMADIPAGAEITFDYNTTEWDMAAPFTCRCGAAACAGLIRGYRHLDGAARARLLPLLSDHLRIRA